MEVLYNNIYEDITMGNKENPALYRCRNSQESKGIRLESF